MTNEEKITQLEKQVAILNAQIETQKETIKELKDQHKTLGTEHKELKEQHNQLADKHSTHQGKSQLLNILYPILTIIGGYVAHYLTKKQSEGKIKELLSKSKE